MRKKIFGSIAILAIAAVAAWNVNLISKNSPLSDIMLANVEALAQETLPEVVITCSYPSCNGKQCHESTYNWICLCRFNGYTYGFCP